MEKGDYKQQLQICWLTGNLIGDDENIAKELVGKFQLVNWLFKFIDRPKVKTSTMEIVIWNLLNLIRFSMINEDTEIV